MIVHITDRVAAKNATLFLLTLAAVFFASCVKNASPVTFRADAEYTSVDEKPSRPNGSNAPQQGKPSYSGGGLLWMAGDSISIYDASSNAAIHTLTSGAGTGHAVFDQTSGAALSDGPYTAVYPGGFRTSLSQIKLPSVQRSADGSLRELPMYAVSSNTSLMFYNVCGVVRFRISASSAVNLSYIAVTTNINTSGLATVSGSATTTAITTPAGSNTTILCMDYPQSISSARDFYMYLPAATYSSFKITMRAADGSECTKSANTSISVQRGVITAITLPGVAFANDAPEGAASGNFSVAANRKVYFAQGNLQYQASTGGWRFADNQYDYIGSGNSNISSFYSGWIDLFGWGTSGWSESGATCWQPWSTSTTASAYRPGGSGGNDLTGTYARADWGVYNAIVGGGGEDSMWRTPTSGEWTYLFRTRKATTVGATDNARYAKAIVCGTKGVIIFPDIYIHPAAVAVPANINVTSANYTSNNYSDADWTAMENAGAVFLPAAGYRRNKTVNDAGTRGLYWAATHATDNAANILLFVSGNLNPASSNNRYDGASIRLVRNAE